ncbi:MAG: Gfo/Idh/MocA family oxidoreductase [Lachnospiraceae bacterium]|nr:Gfo/Idh/MocA family oxidoreductase [Lachnospiraceae bacterium]MDE7204137.1 Gfo/Idh/MocA family oxidoreductase [Lachnospiraceae bacterium]
MFKQKRIGIMGTGKMAGVMAGTVKKMKNVRCHGVASRSEDRAQEFANEYGVKVAYTSYEEMMLDNKIDLIYIATPHSEHYANMKLCIENGKNVLCEKAFTANAKQTEEILALAKKKSVFVAEAMWVRYMPMLTTIKGILNSGIIGEPTMLTANLGYPISDKKRLTEPALAGGALLDLGVYLLNFAAMMFGKDIDKIDSSCVITDTGVDASESITITYKDGRVAVLNCTMNGLSDRRGVIYGPKGYIAIENINNFASVTVYDVNYKAVKSVKAPKQITGYEYEVYSCMEAIEKGEKECWEMPHDEILRIMKQMDELRAQWGVVFPFEKEDLNKDKIELLTGEVEDTMPEVTDIQA